jgi:PAS domain S-box-containing protein
MSEAAETGPDLLSDHQRLERICVRNLLANPEERVYFKDLEGRFVMVSEGDARFLLGQVDGLGVDQVVGKSDFDFFTPAHAAAAFEDEQRVVRTGEAMVAKVEHETFPDRPDAWVSTTKLPLRDDDGRIVGIFGIGRDVTAQVLAEQALTESEARFRSIFEQAPLGIFRLGPDGRIDDVNPALCELVGRTAPELYGSLRSDLFEEVPRPGAAGDQPVGGPRSSRCRARRPDGTVRVVQVNDVVIDDKEGGSHTLVATVEDITDGLRLAEDLQQAQQMEALGRLAGGVAHEINTPTQFISDNLAFLANVWAPVANILRVSLDAVERLRAGDAPGEVAAVLEQSCREADLDFVQAEVPTALAQSQEGVERVATIVRAMRAFGRPDTTEPEPTDIDRLVANAVTVARNELKYVAEVTTEFWGPPTTKCYPGAISQVLLNILVNAAYAVGQDQPTRGRRGEIKVKTWGEGDEACISISDNGPGIPDDVLPRIFQPFFTTKPFGSGTGQGLALAWATVVERHRGRIDVATSDAGTTFTLRLPVAGAAGAARLADGQGSTHQGGPS